MYNKNEGTTDRLIRLVISELALMAGYFWLWGSWQIVAYVLGLVALFTALTGFCLLYKPFGISTNKTGGGKISKYLIYVLYLIIIVLPIAGSYYSNFFTKKLFLEDFNRMNNYYKQTLFYTGQEKRAESLDNYQKLTAEYSVFSKKYTAYHPYVIKKDGQFNSDLNKIAQIVSGLSETVTSGNLKEAHLKFEAVRPISQDILKRNGFSMLAVSLVDFHDSMEKVIAAADKKDAKGVIETYIDADLKLKAVEAEANDSEIQTIRQKLEETLTLAKNGKPEALSAKAAEMKASFVKVYLKRG